MSNAAASPLPKQAQQVTDAFFNLQRIARDRDGALALCKAYPAVIQRSTGNSPSTSPRPSLHVSTPSASPAPLPYLRHLQSQQWASLAASTLSHTFLSYHAAAVLAIVRMRQIEHLASALSSATSTTTSPTPSVTALLRSVSQLRAEWRSLEALRSSLLHHSSYAQQLQLSLIPRTPFPSVLQLLAVHEPAAILDSAAGDAAMLSVIAASRQTAQMPSSASSEAEFLLHFRAGIHRQLSALTAAFLSADHRLSAPASPSPVLSSPYVACIQQLISSLHFESSAADSLRRVKSSRWLRCCQSSLTQRIVQYAEAASRRYEQLEGSRAQQALVLHSDLCCVLDMLTPLPAASSAALLLRLSLSRLESSCIAQCRPWLEAQFAAAFGPALQCFPLILPAFPAPLPVTDDIAALFSAPAAASSPSPPVLHSPLLCIYAQWYAPLLSLSRSLHEGTQRALLPALLDCLCFSLFSHLSTLIPFSTPRINANGAALLMQELLCIAPAASRTLPGCSRLHAALHLLSHAPLYRRSLAPDPPHRQKAATVAPLPETEAAAGGAQAVKLEGRALDDWKGWLALSSGKWRRQHEEGLRNSEAEGDGNEAEHAAAASPSQRHKSCIGCW